jgi:hypothetical protein
MRTDASCSKAEVASRWCLHADLDKSVRRPELFIAYSHLLCSVYSTLGHYHACVPLSEPVSEAESEALQDALVKLPRVKTCGDDVLLAPWTEPIDKPTTVWWTHRSAKLNPRELAEWLGVDLDNCKTGSATASTNGQQPYDGEPINPLEPEDAQGAGRSGPTG